MGGSVEGGGVGGEGLGLFEGHEQSLIWEAIQIRLKMSMLTN